MFVPDPIADALLRGAVFVVVTTLWVILLVRWIGLRSFSKMTAFDFVATLATASLLASSAIAQDLPSFLQPVAAIGMLFLFQFGLSWLRSKSVNFRKLIDNTPHVLVRDGVFDDEALAKFRVTRSDVMAKIRGSSASALGNVKAVVLETTGDISVVIADADNAALLEEVGG